MEHETKITSRSTSKYFDFDHQFLDDVAALIVDSISKYLENALHIIDVKILICLKYVWKIVNRPESILHVMKEHCRNVLLCLEVPKIYGLVLKSF